MRAYIINTKYNCTYQFIGFQRDCQEYVGNKNGKFIKKIYETMSERESEICLHGYGK